MRRLDKELENRKIEETMLRDCGFIKKNDGYTYETTILNNKFNLIINVSKDLKMTSKLIEIATNDEYLLADATGIKGKFVKNVQEEYEKKLNDIINQCTSLDIYKSEYTKKVIKYMKNKYNDDLEFLWPSTPKNAIFRHKDSKKWYCVLLTLSKRKLGFDDDEIVEIIDLRNTSAEILTLVDNKYFFPGYHMNKKHWFTIILDGSVSIEKVFKYIDISYNIK